MKLSFFFKTICILLFTQLLLYSCKEFPSDVEVVLEKAGSNQPELEKVLEHYRSRGEKQKFQAACFLISNMENKFSTYSKDYNKAYLAFNDKKDWYRENKSKKNQYKMTVEIDSLIQNNYSKPTLIFDMNVITADYLIDNIDLAFKVWKEPWAKHFNFDEFCEYILPYRVKDEPLSNWRSTFYKKYFWVKDSVKNVRDTKEIALYINDLIGKDYINESFLDLPSIPVTSLELVKGGVCNQRYLLMISIFRAMGVPAMIDYAPQNNSSFKGHAWMAYLDTLHELRPCDGGISRKELAHTDKPSEAFPDKSVLPLAHGFGSNVFRYNFSVNHKALASKVKDLSTIPAFFRATNLKNVTDEYEFPQQTIRYPIPREIAKKNDVVYLAVFGYGKTFHPTNWCNIENGIAKFEHTGAGIVYLVCTYKDGKLIPFSNPILLKDSTNSTILEPDLTHRQNVILTRKCNVSIKMKKFAQLMVGCLFQGSSNKNFDSPETLYKITNVPEFLVKQGVLLDNNFRYVRFFSPHNDIHVAEIQFWGLNKTGETVKLKGWPIWYLSNDSVIKSQPLNAMDGDIHTNFDAPAFSWVGYDLGKPQQIKAVGYLARNNFNIIVPGNEYELLYYNKGWQSLGVKTTDNQYLEYDNVPSHALFLLKNLTRGREERIFTYENNKQVWW